MEFPRGHSESTGGPGEPKSPRFFHSPRSPSRCNGNAIGLGPVVHAFSGECVCQDFVPIRCGSPKNDPYVNSGDSLVHAGLLELRGVVSCLYRPGIVSSDKSTLGAHFYESNCTHTIRTTGCAAVHRGRKTYAQGQSGLDKALRRIGKSTGLVPHERCAGDPPDPGAAHTKTPGAGL